MTSKTGDGRYRQDADGRDLSFGKPEAHVNLLL